MTIKQFQNAQRQSQKKPWFNSACEAKRKEFFTAKKTYKSNQNDENRRKLKGASCEYKKQLKSEFNIYNRNFNQDLKCLKRNNSKEYWKMLTQSKKSSNAFDVSIDSLYDYFRNLNQSNESNFVPGDFSLIDCVVGDNDVINEPITDIEIEYCINNLKNNKSHGIDEILNEYINCTKLTMRYRYM
ncbi:hypothetical protein SNE40_009852 [Patella caerulea]|uniref:Uncharacterized protein n=1 Tax=Patella caerulea TaxID=87958 RepID=A0AAN8JWJ7_PATCE